MRLLTARHDTSAHSAGQVQSPEAMIGCARALRCTTLLQWHRCFDREQQRQRQSPAHGDWVASEVESGYLPVFSLRRNHTPPGHLWWRQAPTVFGIAARLRAAGSADRRVAEHAAGGGDRSRHGFEALAEHLAALAERRRG
jgi:hypothetical protein